MIRQRFEELVKRETAAIFGRTPATTEREAAPSRSAFAQAGALWHDLAQPSDEEPAFTGPAWQRESPPEDLFGLALSGGGIRSATFSLGLLQGLTKLGVLSGFHYLSTVSGGGYLGGFWSAWKHRTACPPAQQQPPSSAGVPPPGPLPGPFPEPRGGQPEAAEVRHLREFSNFLQPRLALLSFETGRVVAALVGAILPSLLVALSVLSLGWLLWLGLAWLLLGEAVAGETVLGIPLPGLVAFSLVAFVLLCFEWAWSYRPQEEGVHRPAAFLLAAAFACTTAGAAAAAAASLAPRAFGNLLRPLHDGRVDAALATTVLLPAIVFAATAMLLVGLRVVFSTRANLGPDWRLRLNALDRVLARLVLLTTVWVVAGAAWLAAQWIAAGGLAAAFGTAGAGGAGGGLYALLRRRLFAEPNKPTGGRTAALAKPWLLKLVAYLAVVALAAAAGSLLVLIGTAAGSDGLWLAFWSIVGFLIITIAVFEPHEVGFHSFYRGRIVRAFLGASNQGPPPPRWATADCAKDDLPLTALPPRPLHLICCAANDLSGDPLPSLNRGADSAALSCHGIQVGDHWRPWGEGERSPTLGDALTASAAAFNSQMGRHSISYGPAATFLLAALNLRLGLWLENPGHSQRPLATAWADAQRRRRGLLYFRELLGASSARSTWIHLSDGAHFENLALYELVRRHCRFILLSDCGADPDRSFDDFGNAVRRIREDFGVEIRIDVTPLKPGADRLSRQPAVAGDVVYGKDDVGVLLYVKPTLTGGEPPDIANYARRNTAFPHETTIDQFYDEAQWESYRRLGEYAVETAFRGHSL